MTDVSPISRSQLQSRRKSLRRQRRLNISQALWRLMAMAGLTTAIFWGATRPVWLIYGPEQITVSGNQLLSETMVQNLVPLEYPQPLLKVEPETIARQLRDRAPVTSVDVTRQLLPPRLNIQVQERVPVAIVEPPNPQSNIIDTQYLQPGLLDAHGAWMPISSFALNPVSTDLPTLRLRGIQPQYQRYWPQIYETIRHSPVAIRTIDWQDPSNLVLETELGVVYLGPYTPELQQQLATLDRMRNLPEQLGTDDVAHIDLTNPMAPTIAIVEGDDGLDPDAANSSGR
jgi:cell division protein FtsQ